MTELVLSITVAAPMARCFDLARSMDFHCWSMRATGERIVAGRALGLIGLGEEVEFEGKHLGLSRRLRGRVTEFEPGRRFVDEQVAGPFRALRHEHLFEEVVNATRVTDRVTMAVGWGWLGRLVEPLVVRPHLERVLRGHQANLKAAAESDQWQTFLAQSPSGHGPS